MPFALTLVASTAPLSAGHIAVAERILEQSGIGISRGPQWLSPHKAVDLMLRDALSPAQMARMQEVFEEDKIDVFCTANTARRKKLLCADMESTIIRNEMLEELAGALGLREEIAAITARAMNGEIAFAQALEERVSMLKGLSANVLSDALETLDINPGAQTLIATMAANGATCVLITGGFTVFSAHIAEKLGFHHHHANTLQLSGGILTGTLEGAILGPEAKLEYLKHYCAQRSITPADTIALGDGANDLPMLSAAGLGIGYRPKPALRGALGNHILHGDFTAALYAQGYTEKEFVA